MPIARFYVDVTLALQERERLEAAPAGQPSLFGIAA